MRFHCYLRSEPYVLLSSVYYLIKEAPLQEACFNTGCGHMQVAFKALLRVALWAPSSLFSFLRSRTCPLPPIIPLSAFIRSCHVSSAHFCATTCATPMHVAEPLETRSEWLRDKATPSRGYHGSSLKPRFRTPEKPLIGRQRVGTNAALSG